jgi:hypothetical protein
MNKEQLVYVAFALLDIGLFGTLAAQLRHRVTTGRVTEAKAKRAHLMLGIGLAVLSSLLLLFAIVEFQLPLGHGVVLIFAPIYSLLLASILIFAGRIVIGWEQVRW